MFAAFCYVTLGMFLGIFILGLLNLARGDDGWPGALAPIDIARVAHQVNKAYCEAVKDFTQKDWEEAPQWQRDSALKGVEFHLKYPNASASLSHRSWMAEKREQGWRYGPVKDEAKKEHPCMKPFRELPVEQQAKDYLFREVVRQLRPYMGWMT